MDHDVSYKYYSRRPIDLGTYPKAADNLPMVFYNYDEYANVPGIGREAWGELIYRKPLTRKEIEDYELIPSPANLDLMNWMEEKAQLIGKCEDKAELSSERRLTWWIPSRGMYLFKPPVTPGQVQNCLSAYLLQQRKEHRHDAR